MYKIINKNKVLGKIYKELCKLDKHTVSFIKTGVNIFFLLFVSGTLISILNKFIIDYNPYNEFLAMSVIKSSFIVLAEVIIGCLLLDSAFNK